MRTVQTQHLLLLCVSQGTFNDEETEDGEDDFESHDSEPEHEFSISDDE